MTTPIQNPPLEPDQMDAWRDDGGSCAHGHPEHRLAPISDERPVWERASSFVRNLISPTR